MRQSLTQHIIGLVNLSLILGTYKIIIHAHHRSIVQIAGHHLLLGKERSQIIIFHPEERILGTTISEVVITCHDRTKCQHLGMESSRTLVVIGRLLDIIGFHLTGRNVTVIQLDSTVILLFIIDMVVVQESQRLHTVGSSKTLVSIHTILIDVNLARHHQSEY